MSGAKCASDVEESEKDGVRSRENHLDSLKASLPLSSAAHVRLLIRCISGADGERRQEEERANKVEAASKNHGASVEATVKGTGGGDDDETSVCHSSPPHTHTHTHTQSNGRTK